MSSTRDSPEEPFPEPERTTAPRWPAWRVTMLIGSLVLLCQAIYNSGQDRELPGWLNLVASTSGYAMLVIGFGLAMNARNKR